MGYQQVHPIWLEADRESEELQPSKEAANSDFIIYWCQLWSHFQATVPNDNKTPEAPQGFLFDSDKEQEADSRLPKLHSWTLNQPFFAFRSLF